MTESEIGKSVLYVLLCCFLCNISFMIHFNLSTSLLAVFFLYILFLEIQFSFFLVVVMKQGEWTRSTGCPTHYFTLVVVFHPKSRKWLAVEETRERGWWLPGGFVECGDNHLTTAIKETKEEAGIDINIVGLLTVQSGIQKHGARQRVIYLAVPKDLNQAPKSVADEESKSAKWVTTKVNVCSNILFLIFSL